MANAVTHIVRPDGNDVFASATLPPEALDRLRAAFRTGGRWSNPWRNPKLREAARHILAEHGSLAILGGSAAIDVPAPFTEPFDPIELNPPTGGNRARLKPLSGEKPTRQERDRWFPVALFGGAALVMAAIGGREIWRDPSPANFAVAGGMLLALAIITAVVFATDRLRGKWYLVPGAIAIVRRPARRGQAARVTVLSRADSCLVFHRVRAQVTDPSQLAIEVWTRDGKSRGHPVTERETISVLAAWQSPLTPPPDERLRALAW